MPAAPKWNEHPCPECKEPIAFDATRCPRCQAVFDPATIERRMNDHRHNSNLKLGGCGFLVALFVLMVAFCSDSESVPDEPGVTAKADAIAFYETVLSTVAQCDRASAAVGEVVKTNDALASYRAARSAANTCLGVSSDIRAIEVPVSLGKKAHGELTEVREQCENAYTARWSALSSLTEVLNGEGGMESLADLNDAAERSSLGVSLCVSGMMGPLLELGVTTEEIGAIGD